MTAAYLNVVAVAVPDHDMHAKFVTFGPALLSQERDCRVFRRMAARSQIEHRYSVLQPHADAGRLDSDDFYRSGASPDTAARMKMFEQNAFALARRALDQLSLDGVTHLIVTTCTGFYAPGLDLQILAHYGLDPAVERTVIGFMGCYAAINALKLARHIVRSEDKARVLILNLELCTLHMQPDGTLEEILSFLIFADGCAASIVSAQPCGLELRGFHAHVMADSAEQITWNIGGFGFDMMLAGAVPGTIAAGLPAQLGSILGGLAPEEIVHWAVHPGGRSILDAVRDGAGLAEEQLALSRRVLRDFGNMSSATIMFVLHDILQTGTAGAGCGMAFGPGLTVESVIFYATGLASDSQGSDVPLFRRTLSQ